MQKRVPYFIITLLAMLVLASCTSAPFVVEPKLTFVPPIRLKVSAIKLENQSDQDAVPRFSESFRLSEKLQQAVQAWSDAHLLSVGGNIAGIDTAYLVINQAVLKETQLPRPSGIAGAFIEAPSERYEGEIDVRLETRDVHGFTARSASAQVKQTRYAYAKMTLSEREALWSAIINNILVTLDQALKQRIATHLGSLIDMAP